MPVIYARECRSNAWEGAKEDVIPSLVVADLVERSEQCSVWKVDDPSSPNLILIAAALAVREKKVVPVAFRFISDYYIKKFGLTITQTLGETVDSTLNGTNTHYELELPVIDNAVMAAKGFIAREKKEGQICVFVEKEILIQIAASIKAKRIPFRQLDFSLLGRLIDEGYLSIA